MLGLAPLFDWQRGCARADKKATGDLPAAVFLSKPFRPVRRCGKRAQALAKGQELAGVVNQPYPALAYLSA